MIAFEHAAQARRITAQKPGQFRQSQVFSDGEFAAVAWRIAGEVADDKPANPQTDSTASNAWDAGWKAGMQTDLTAE